MIGQVLVAQKLYDRRLAQSRFTPWPGMLGLGRGRHSGERGSGDQRMDGLDLNVTGTTPARLVLVLLTAATLTTSCVTRYEFPTDDDCLPNCENQCMGGDDGCGGVCEGHTCKGCCQIADNRPRCYSGSEPGRCGNGGAPCQTCQAPTGFCNSGQCSAEEPDVVAEVVGDLLGDATPSCPNCENRCPGQSDGCGGICKENTCPGCCASDGTVVDCVVETTKMFCGTGGENCQVCGTGQDCNKGVCSAAVCTPSCVGKCIGESDGCTGTCTENDCAGCCTDIPTIVCMPGDKSSACGKSGQSCTDCGFASCLEGACCEPSCGEKQCGDDGCGGSCGSCFYGTKCDVPSGKCVCDPECPEPSVCDILKNQCFCPETQEPTCNGQCCTADQECFNLACCTPACSGKECGDDGCGGSCGTCTGANVCIQGKCQSEPDCGDGCYIEGATQCDGIMLQVCTVVNGQKCWVDSLCPKGQFCEVAQSKCACPPNCLINACEVNPNCGDCGHCPSGKTCVNKQCI